MAILHCCIVEDVGDCRRGLVYRIVDDRYQPKKNTTMNGVTE